MATDPNSIVDYLGAQGKASDFNSRSSLYGSSGLNLGAYTGSAAQNTALLGYLKTPKTPAATLATPPQAPSTTMVASDIQSNATTPVPVLPPAPSPVNYAPTMASIPTIESIVAPAAPSAAETEQTGLMASLKGLYEKMLGKTSAQAKAEETAGLPGYNTQLNDINAQIKQLQAESSSATIRADDRLAPTFAITGEQTRIEHERTIKALGLSSISSAIQGNIALAQQQADRAVEIEFGPIQEQIDYQQKLLDLNKTTLEREDKKALTLQQAQLDERQRLLDNAKEDKGIIIGWAAEASKNGASSYVVNQALAESDPSKALGILNGFLTDPMAKEKALAELEQTRAQTNLTNEQIRKSKEKAPESVNGSFQEINGRTVLVNTKTGEVIKDYGAKPLSATEKKAELDKIDQAKASLPALDEKVTLLDKIIKDGSYKSAVGPNAGARMSPFEWFGSARGNAIADIQTLVSQETLSTLLELKKAGGTLGAISEKELAILGQSATKISNWAQHGDSSDPLKVTGYKTTEAAFEAEIAKIRASAQKMKDAAEADAGVTKASDDIQVVNGVRYKKAADGLYYPE